MRKRTESVKPGDELLFLGTWRSVTKVASRRWSFQPKPEFTFEFKNYPPVTAHPGETFECRGTQR